jgi:hypothetical protein
MSHHQRRIIALLAFVAGGILAGCSDVPSNGPPATLLAPAVPSADAAFVGRIPFTEPGVVFPPLDAPCLNLGESLTITGTISGWYQLTQTSLGHQHWQEYDDFTGLTASGGGRTWSAGPGAHEIWSENLPATDEGYGETAYDIVHEGRSPFVGPDGTTQFILVHRIHQVLTPGLDLVVDNVSALKVQCVGSQD